MCGIFGSITLKKNFKIDKRLFLNSLALISHRGPDDEGYFINDKIAFGHKRLSIIDLSKRGHQPMFSHNKSSLITYNGEIYNFKDLKRDLKFKGYKFKNKTDTEVLLNGLIDQGPNFITKCNGMFAFAFYNKNTKISYIFRDRIGIKPLFYSIDNNQISFSSNLKAISTFTKNHNILDQESISSYFSFRQPLGNKTYFKKIHSLEPGHYIEIRNNKIKIKKYWDHKKFFLQNKIDKGEEFYNQKLSNLVESSVKYRLISDVKVASLLSGGLDSTIIAAIINKQIRKNFLAYSIGYSYKDYNEFRYSKLVAKKLNMHHSVISTTAENYFDDMDKLIQLRGSPLTIPNEASQFKLCNEIKKKATVVLSGSGSDELFCGYGRIFGSVEDFKKIKNLDYFKKKSEKSKFIKNMKKRYGKTSFKSITEHFLSLYSYTDENIKKKILHKDINQKKINFNIYDFFSKIFEDKYFDNYLDRMQYFFQKYHLKGILEREDMSSMASAVELRVPFLDHRIIEFAATIPNKYKTKVIRKQLELTSDKSSEVNDITKYILRKAFENEIPKQILDRKKIGFPVPLHTWMSQKKIKDRIYETLLSSKSKNRGILDTNYLKKLLSRNDISSFSGSSKVYQSSSAHKIWMCFNLEKFFLNNE